ncbi:MAG: hypothetical protein ABI181_13870 [Mycobacteriaceae bacterium]
MLLLALGAVVVGFAFLVVALLSQDASWAWGCIAACVVGAGFVVADAVRRRHAPRAVPELAAAPGGPGTEQVVAQLEEPTPEPTDGHGDDPDVTGSVEVSPGPLAADTGPAEESAEAADALRLSGLAVSVLVVDEHPRFHVAGCSWLEGRTTMTLPVGEAVDLEFTPCAWCTPVVRLAGSPPGPGSD